MDEKLTELQYEAMKSFPLIMEVMGSLTVCNTTTKIQVLIKACPEFAIAPSSRKKIVMMALDEIIRGEKLPTMLKEEPDRFLIYEESLLATEEEQAILNLIQIFVSGVLKSLERLRSEPPSES